MPKKGKFEEEISNAMVKLQKEVTGRGANEAKSKIVEDMVIVRLKNVLTPSERLLAQDTEGKKLIKELRYQLEEKTRPAMEKIIENILNVKVISMHSDISTKTGERLDVFILEKNIEEDFKS